MVADPTLPKIPQGNIPQETASPLLSVRDFSVVFCQNGKEKTILDQVSFSLHKSEILGLVGESGSGKSILALCLMQLLPSSKIARMSGSILFDGKELIGASENTLCQVRGKGMAMIFQEPMSSLNPLHTVERHIRESLQRSGKIEDRTTREHIADLLDQVGIDRPEDRLAAYPHQLSGGQRQRVMIAAALAQDPQLLIADEPTTALDATVQIQILELLQQLQKTRGMAMLLITHDFGIVRKLAERVCVMTAGHIVEQGKTTDVLKAPSHAYTQSLLQAEYKGQAEAPNPAAPCIMQSQSLRVWFPIKRGLLQRTVDYIKAVDDVTVELRSGQTLGIVGESGSGKTTLGLALMRLIPSRGRILYLGQNIQDLGSSAMRPLRQKLQIVFQDPYGTLSPRFSVEQIVGEGLLVHHKALSRSQRREQVQETLIQVGLEPADMDRYPHEFSGGQRQRISIARAMILKPDIIMLDEPTSALDMRIQSQILTLLHDFQKNHGLSYFFISHDLRAVRALAHHIIVMYRGKILEQGTAAEIFASPRAEYTKVLMQAAFNLGGELSIPPT